MIQKSNIEVYFLTILLRISFIGVLLITIFDLVFEIKETIITSSNVVDITILTCIGLAFLLLHFNKYHAAVITATFTPLTALFYSNIYLPHSTTAMAAIIAVGFSFSILLNGTSRKIMHAYVCSGMSVVFYFQFADPSLYLKTSSGEVITTFIIYAVVYIIITFSASALKLKYDSINQELISKNQELLEKNILMEKKNQELIESENQMNEINIHLEHIVEERTNNVKSKNEYLIKYAFANAHHVRGPLARILGLLQLAKIGATIDYPFLFNNIEQQAEEIDEVLKTINKELEEGQDIFF